MRRQNLVALAALVVLAGCARQSPPADAQGRAQAISQQAASPEQARLWQEAAQKGAAVGIDQVAVPAQPIVERSRVMPVARPAATQTVAPLPASIQGAARILSAPPVDSFTGEANVVSVDGERIELSLGQRVLTIQARAGGGPLQIKAGERAQVDYRVRDDPADRQRILAVRTAGGDGVITALDSAAKPVSLQVSLFRLVASQTGTPANGSMPVEVRVGDVRRTLTAGQSADVGGVTVGILASTALTGADAFRAEGNPYAIDLVAWVTRRPVQ